MKHLLLVPLLLLGSCASKPDAFDFALDRAMAEMFSPETLPIQAHKP
jgi:hypothetical protein